MSAFAGARLPYVKSSPKPAPWKSVVKNRRKPSWIGLPFSVSTRPRSARKLKGLRRRLIPQRFTAQLEWKCCSPRLGIEQTDGEVFVTPFRSGGNEKRYFKTLQYVGYSLRLSFPGIACFSFKYRLGTLHIFCSGHFITEKKNKLKETTH